MAEAVTRVEISDPESAFLSSNQETGFEWELFKENVRPLKRGRNVRLLNHALKSHSHHQLTNDLLEKRRFTASNFRIWDSIRYQLFSSVFVSVIIRKLIESIDEYDGDDPLFPWIQ